MPDQEHEDAGVVSADELWSVVELDNILPYRLEYASRKGGFDDLPDPRESDGAFDVDTNVMVSDQGEVVIVRLQAQVSGEQFVITTDNAAFYSKPASRSLTTDAQQSLVHHGVMTIYPYLREQVSSFTARRGQPVHLAVLDGSRLHFGVINPES